VLHKSEDIESTVAAQEFFDQLRKELPIPNQEIPDGDKTRALLNYNYEEFDELFTDRHLLTFGLLLRKVWDVREEQFSGDDSQNIAEFLVTLVLASLEYN
jgi:adenine-specific DNA methylase